MPLGQLPYLHPIKLLVQELSNTVPLPLQFLLPCLSGPAFSYSGPACFLSVDVEANPSTRLLDQMGMTSAQQTLSNWLRHSIRPGNWSLGKQMQMYSEPPLAANCSPVQLPSLPASQLGQTSAERQQQKGREEAVEVEAGHST